MVDLVSVIVIAAEVVAAFFENDVLNRLVSIDAGAQLSMIARAASLHFWFLL